MSQRSVLVERLASNLGLTKVAADNLLLNVVGAIKGHLSEHGEVVLPTLGRLKNETRPARAGRNPRTGESIQVPEKVVTKFKAFPAKSAEAAE